MKILPCLIGVLACILPSIAQEELIVNITELGRIRGARGLAYAEEENGARIPFVQFLDIPYATVPQRFRPSEMLETDLGQGEIYNATRNTAMCSQVTLPGFETTEDCLRINIYTHQVYNGDENQLRPVIFFIHGGAFTIGVGRMYNGARLLNRDVVLVNFNYRLGLLGFFTLQNEDVPGNAGLYDVVTALEWTRKYIRHFGGDPNQITIAGQSAGAVMVTQLMTSPMVQGMFQNAIVISGSALNAWGTATNPLQESLVIANRAGCYDNAEPDYAAIATCMRNVTASDLVGVLLQYQMSERRQGRLGFTVGAPVVQDFPMQNLTKVLPEHPRDVFIRGGQAPVPLMMSNTKHDGSYVSGVVYFRYLVDNNLVGNTTFLRTRFVPTILNSLDIPDIPSGIHDTITQTYMGNNLHSGDWNEMYPGLVDIFSVFFFKGDGYQTALYHSAVAPTYWSSFEFQGHASLWSSLWTIEASPPPFPGGVCHGDDLIYLFAVTFNAFDENEYNVSRRMCSYWANFARNGRPSEDWPELTAENEQYMVVNLNSSIVPMFKNSWAGAGYDVFPTTVTPQPTTASTEPVTPEDTTTTVVPTTIDSTPTVPTTQGPTQNPTSENPSTPSPADDPPSTTAGSVQNKFAITFLFLTFGIIFSHL